MASISMMGNLGPYRTLWRLARGPLQQLKATVLGSTFPNLGL
jgi:hypothetical protein